MCQVRVSLGMMLLPLTRLIIHEALREGNSEVLFSGIATGAPTPHKTALAIDSLSFLLLHHSAPTLCRWLMATCHAHILCLLHSNLHVAGVLAQIDSIATSHLTVTSAQLAQNNCYTGQVSTVHRRLSGRILRQVSHHLYHLCMKEGSMHMLSFVFLQIETHFISADFASLSSVDCTLQQSSKSTGAHVDPAANLTFDLHLSAKEKVARSQVVLPYTHAQEEGLVSVAPHTGSGQIFYEPDEGDCFTDSDPDEDLDF